LIQETSFILSGSLENPLKNGCEIKQNVQEEGDGKVEMEEFYKYCCDGEQTFHIGDWVTLNVNKRTIYGVIRYFFKSSDSRNFVYITELTLVGIGPPYTVKSFIVGEERYYLVNCLEEKIRMVPVPSWDRK